MAVIYKPSPIARPTRELCIMACTFCRDRNFWKWVTQYRTACASEAEAKLFICTMSGVTSRTHLDTNPEAAKRFHELIRAPFLAWKEAQG